MKTFCRHCGHERVASDAFCSECREPFEDDAGGPPAGSTGEGATRTAVEADPDEASAADDLPAKLFQVVCGPTRVAANCLFQCVYQGSVRITRSEIRVECESRMAGAPGFLGAIFAGALLGYRGAGIVGAASRVKRHFLINPREIGGHYDEARRVISIQNPGAVWLEGQWLVIRVVARSGKAQAARQFEAIRDAFAGVLGERFTARKLNGWSLKTWWLVLCLAAALFCLFMVIFLVATGHKGTAPWEVQ